MRLFIQSFLFCFLISCSCQQKANENNLPKHITGINYQPIDKDTVVTEKALSMYNEPYELTIRKYSSNDSAVMNKVTVQDENGTKEILNISHNYLADILLTKNGEDILSCQLSKETFKDSLDTEFYEASVLLDVQFEFVRTNRLYFIATMAIPDTDMMHECMFAVFYLTEKKGKIDFWNLSDNYK